MMSVMSMDTVFKNSESSVVLKHSTPDTSSVRFILAPPELFVSQSISETEQWNRGPKR